MSLPAPFRSLAPAWLALALATPTVGTAAGVALQYVDKAYGGATLTFALPREHSEITGGEALEKERRNVPPSNEFIARFDSADPFIYTTIQGFVPTKGAVLTPAEFEAARQSVRAEVARLSPETAALMRELEQRASADYRAERGGVAAINVSRPVVFDIFDESERHISFLLFLSVVTTTPDGRQLQTNVAASMTCALLRGKVVYLYFFRPFLGLPTYDQLRETSRAAVRETLAKNR